ncbi:cupin domain-containing protein [Romeria aff. gracilis LEGE 07310]|uniref:Cupin domain-containing protein n=1 Tax=Vasconcelosia minhoensis LEGE 07310 TaxID=915328 RepID=A0A8J7DDP7_9CYAN|nr:cupin domain-containing protein [Romeria gracilis]MBE9079013.1 cupin domain-containing protein [Romeria aff. gracilis LEGE 07310]
MGNPNLETVNQQQAPAGGMGQQYLAQGDAIAMRLWQDEQPGESKPSVSRDYETVGYVLKGKAELEIEGKTLSLKVGDSWVVPKGAAHTYKILETFSAIEATHPPARAVN